MPTINKPFLLKLVLSCLVLTGVLFGAHALQARRIPDALRQQADRAAEAGKSDSAIHYLRQYLEFKPEDVEALVELADQLRRRNNSARGHAELVFLYDKIIRLDPERDTTRREALAHCLRLGRYSDAVTHAEALLKNHPDDADLWQQLGAGYVGLNQMAEARTAYATAVGHAPNAMIGYQRLAQLLWKNMNLPEESRSVLDRMVAAMPQDPHAYLVRARFRAFRSEEIERSGHPADLESALADLRRVLELDPENAEASLLVAEILQKGRDVPAAHTILRDAATLYPRNLRLVRSLAWHELVRGNVAAAVAVLEDGLKQSPEGIDLLVPLADLLVQQGDGSRAVKILKHLESRRAPQLQVKYLKARIAMRKELWFDAIVLLQALRTETFNLPGLETQVNMLLAVCFQNTGDADAQEKSLRRVTGTDPGSVPARVALATLYMNQGRFEEAGREYETAMQSPYAPGEVVAQWVRLTARQLQLGGGSSENWRKLEQVVARAVTKFGPVSSDHIILSADVAAAQSKETEAVRILRKASTARPGDTRLWGALAEATAAASGTAAGLAVIDEAQAAAGDGPEIRLARARLYTREPACVRPIEPLAERIESWAEADQLRLLYGLVELYDRASDRVKLVATLRQLAARRPTDLAIWIRLHERALEAGNAAAVAEARAGLIRIEGESGPSVLICDAVATMDLQLTDRLIATFGPLPNRADACLALAKLRAQAGDLREALHLAERAFILKPTQYDSLLVRLLLHCRSGGEEMAAKLVKQLAFDPRWAGDAFWRVICGLIEQVPPDMGARVAEWCRTIGERESGGLGRLATCYTAAGRAADAEATLVAATMRPSATADDWLRLAVHHYGVGKKAGAVETLTAAREQLPLPQYFAICVVFQEMATGEKWSPKLTSPADKRAFAQARLALCLSRSDKAAAVMVLEDLLNENDIPSDDAGWARRNLAMLYAIGGTADDRQRAMSLLNKAGDIGARPEELRATASVLTTLSKYLEGNDRKAVLGAAAKSLEIAYKASQSPRDLYHLSQLHRVAGNRRASRKCLNELLQRDPKNIYYLIAALDDLVDEREFSTAETFVSRLRSLYSGEFRAVAAIARYECFVGRPDRALAIAEAYAAAAGATAGDYLARSARVAELLDELSRHPNVCGTPACRRIAEVAVERYTALIPSRPEAVVAVAGALAAAGRVDEAFTRIEQSHPTITFRVRAIAGVAALRSGGATDRQYSIVREWLNEALAEEPGSVSLQMSQAEFLALHQNYEDAAIVYEAIIERDPRNVVVLNNLAWLLAADPQTAERSLGLIDRAIREVGLTGELLDTRARARITLKQFARAEQDLREALTQGSTALRWFHLALLYKLQSPAQPENMANAFREARSRGLNQNVIHNTDIAIYQLLTQEIDQ